jgi:hypothetical protein
MRISSSAVLMSIFCSLLVIVIDASPAEALFSSSFDGTTLTISQTANNGNIIIDNNGTGNAFRTTDGSGTVEYVVATNVVVNLFSNTLNNLAVELDTAHPGAITLNLGDGNRTLNFNGFNNTMGGLTINAGAGDQTIELAINTHFAAIDSVAVDLGIGVDRVDENGFDVTIGSDLTIKGAKFENNGTMNVGGNVLYDQRGDDDSGEFDDDNMMNIAGNVMYEGNDQPDHLMLNGFPSRVMGNVVANTREGGSLHYFNVAGGEVQGFTRLIASGSVGLDQVIAVAGTTFGGGVSVDFGDGDNQAHFAGASPAGTDSSYVGGTGVDTVTMNMVAPNMDFVVRLDGDGDTFNLDSVADLKSLYVDFGCGGVDTFTTTFVSVPTWVTLLNEGPCVLPSADLTAVKTNNTAGNTPSGDNFEWSVRVANGDTADAVFADGDVILTDSLPSGATYSALSVVNAVNIADIGRIDCGITGSTLTCSARGAAGVIVGGTAGLGVGRFDVKLQVTPTVSGALVNTCTVDPDSNIPESDEANNTCSDTVAVSPMIVALVPGRVYETRAGMATVDGLQQATGRRAAGQVTEVTIGGRATVPVNAEAAIVNATAINPSDQGFITIYPCGTPRPDASTLNYSPGQVIANGATIKLGTDAKICVYTHRAMDLIIDVTGYIPT